MKDFNLFKNNPLICDFKLVKNKKNYIETDLEDMLYFNEEPNRKHLFFYAGSTCAYLLVFILFLAWTGQVNQVGKNIFYYYLIAISLAEYLKFQFANRFFSQPSFGVGKRSDSLRASKVSRVLSQCKPKDGCKILFVILSLTWLYFLVSILYGASMSNQYEGTLTFSCQLSILTALPTCLLADCNVFVQILLGVKPISNVDAYLSQNVYFTLGGAWLGAVAIPLDWDRTWQPWPIPCSLGSFAGLFLSQLVTLYKLTGEKMLTVPTYYSN